jgi:periplasmic protein TonB
MPSYPSPAPQKSARQRWFIVGLLAIVILGGVLSFIFGGAAGPEKEKMEEYQIVDVTIPPPPPPIEPEEELKDPEDIEESIEPLEMAAGPENSAEESSDVDLGIDIGDLASSSGPGGFVMDIPRFGRGGGGNGDGSDSLGGGELDSPPSPTTKTQPTYPSSLLKKGVGGKVLITCTVDDTGKVTSTTIKQSSGQPELDKAAINAVTLWKFKPGMKAGKPVKAVCVVPFNFEVKKA